MTPEELGRYLAVMRTHGAVLVRLALAPNVAIDVTFGPDSAPLTEGIAPTPGGWKGPDRLDAEFSESVP